MVIWRGTTPKIQIVFKTVDPSTITSAKLTFYTDQATILEKDLSSAEVGSNTLTWALSQEETLSITWPPKKALKAICNYLTSDGTRGVSVEDTVGFKKNPVNEVMS